MCRMSSRSTRPSAIDTPRLWLPSQPISTVISSPFSSFAPVAIWSPSAGSISFQSVFSQSITAGPIPNGQVPGLSFNTNSTPLASTFNTSPPPRNVATSAFTAAPTNSSKASGTNNSGVNANAKPRSTPSRAIPNSRSSSVHFVSSSPSPSRSPVPLATSPAKVGCWNPTNISTS